MAKETSEGSTWLTMASGSRSEVRTIEPGLVGIEPMRPETGALMTV